MTRPPLSVDTSVDELATMNVVHVKDAKRRDACLARLCAEVYGQQAGLTPLVVFTGTRRELFVHEAGRMLALVDREGTPLALALLVLDAAGEGMTLTHSCALGEEKDAERRLISELAFKAPLRVEADSREEESFYLGCGITRWFAGRDGQRIGLGLKHPASSVRELSETLAFDESALLRRFKHDAKTFDDEKQRFVDGLANFPSRLA